MRDRTLNQSCFRREWFCTFASTVLCIALALVAQSYGQEPDAQKISEALKRVQKWHLHKEDPVRQMFDVKLIADAGATEGMPFLEQEFAFTKDTWLKQAVASALVKLGAKEQAYWDFLAVKAKGAVDNDAPSLFQYDSEGKVDRNQPEYSPEFIAWAKAHDQDPANAAQAQTFDLPRNFLYLAEIGDPRGRELLRRGLKSRNYSIEAYAAWGLAKLQDRDSIPLIIEVCSAMNRERAWFIARALVFFDDPRARNAAELLIDKPILEELRKLIREHGPDPFR